MTSDRIVERLRAANPAPAAVIYDDELFARITASPVDPRLPPVRPGPCARALADCG